MATEEDILRRLDELEIWRKEWERRMAALEDRFGRVEQVMPSSAGRLKLGDG